MLEGKKILLTGASGQVAYPIGAFLARHNEVWGAARLADPAAVEKLKAGGMVPYAMDVAAGVYQGLPDDFDYVLHFAFMRGKSGDFEPAMRVNGEGTGMVLQHCRKAKAALVVSSAAIYAPHPDHAHLHREDGDLGRGFAPWSPTSPVTKVAMEATARFAARAFDLPVTIVRLNTVYGSPENQPSQQIRQILAGEPVMVPGVPNNHSPIHVDDMCDQIEPLLAAASVPATVVNWAGDEMVSCQEWCRIAGEMTGREPVLKLMDLPGAANGYVADTTLRMKLTGPCKVRFEDGFRRLVEQEMAAFGAKA